MVLQQKVILKTIFAAEPLRVRTQKEKEKEYERYKI